MTEFQRLNLALPVFLSDVGDSNPTHTHFYTILLESRGKTYSLCRDLFYKEF